MQEGLGYQGEERGVLQSRGHRRRGAQALVRRLHSLQGRRALLAEPVVRSEERQRRVSWILIHGSLSSGGSRSWVTSFSFL